MASSNQPSEDRAFVKRATEASIQIGLVVLLAYWCFQIFQPFFDTIVWGIIIAVATHPLYRRLKSALGGHGKLAATVITLLALVLLIVPIVILSETLFDSAHVLSTELHERTLHVPPPSEKVRSWPIIGEHLYKTWSLASTNLEAALSGMAPQLRAFGSWFLGAAAGTGASILKFLFSIIIAGVLLAKAGQGHQAAQALGNRLAGQRGDELVDLAGATVRSVTQGILGVALIQSILAGLGCLVAGVPGAGLWALLILLLAVVQLPPLMILGPIIIYVFSTADTATAVLFTIWSVFVGASDTFLKPIFLGRGVQVPMVVIFIGAIGGFITSGIIGLFIGATILALGYRLFLAWLQEGDETAQEPGGSGPPPAGETSSELAETK
jgi:predicted PurR-regulated permease PerM